jgi:hypothetical protein
MIIISFNSKHNGLYTNEAGTTILPGHMILPPIPYIYSYIQNLNETLKDVSYYNKIYDYLSTLKLIARGHGGRDRTHCWIYNYLCNKCLSPLTL